jgi:hypothetical protein
MSVVVHETEPTVAVLVDASARTPETFGIPGTVQIAG